MEKYIKRTLDSIKKQTFKDYEVIVIDDGSKDNTAEIAQRYHAKYPESYFVYSKMVALVSRGTGFHNKSNRLYGFCWHLAYIDSVAF